MQTFQRQGWHLQSTFQEINILAGIRKKNIFHEYTQKKNVVKAFKYIIGANVQDST